MRYTGGTAQKRADGLGARDGMRYAMVAGMTTEEVAAIEAAAHECDPSALVSWDREYETLTITCTSECAETVRHAVLPRADGVLLVLRRH